MRSRFCPGRRAWAVWLVVVGLLHVATVPVRSQEATTPQTPQTPVPKTPDSSTATTPPSSSDQANTDNNSSESSNDLGSSVSTFDSAVGYIDRAIPQSLFRLRFDAADGNNRPTRAEFFYAKGGKFGPGLPVFEPKVNYQEIAGYLEYAVMPELSVLINVPYRFLEPSVNPDHDGFGDLYGGFKYAFLYEQDLVASFQLEAYAPTGDAREGLGTNHASVEPAFLLYAKLTDRVVMESELHLWVPIDGTNFSGEVVRYGVGLSYGEHRECGWWVTPVVELVGWTVLNGREQVGPTVLNQKDAGGDTIVNAKFGVRIGSGTLGDLYLGYGRALTGDVWYKDIFRTELRFFF